MNKPTVSINPLPLFIWYRKLEVSLATKKTQNNKFIQYLQVGMHQIYHLATVEQETQREKLNGCVL